jgi:hypothetical protein
MVFDDLDLMGEQEDLLVSLVEAARNVPSDDRQNFLHISTNGPDLLFHDGFAGARQRQVVTQDLDILASAGLLDMSYNSAGNREYWILPRGYRYYEFLKTRAGDPVAQIEADVTKLIQSDDFSGRHPDSHAKWLAAAQLVWQADSEKETTAVGHYCREAVQAFASELVQRFDITNVDANPAHDVARIRAVLEAARSKVGNADRQVLDALLGYWGAVSDLAQRQEHGSQKEGEPLTWEDSRRLVFLTAVLFYEFDRTMNRTSP